MSNQFLPGLIQDYTGLLNNDEYYDIKIQVGERIFHTHMNILCCRSQYLRKAFASNRKQ